MKRKILFFSLMLTFLFASCSNLIDELTVTKEKEANYTVTYTVTFNSNGGSDVESQTVASGSKATEPAVPEKNGSIFNGWYSDSGLTTPFSFDTAITADITLYAKWTETAVKQAGNISYASTTVSKTSDDAAFTNELTKTGNGAVTYASSKTEVAEVNTQTGLVTIKGAGETTITATVADSESYTYAVNTATYTLTVTAAAATKTLTLTGQYFDFINNGFVKKSLEIEYSDNDTWKDIAGRYNEVSLEDNIYGPSDGKIVMFWADNDRGCELKSEESTYKYDLVSINDKVSAYSSYYLED